MKFNTIPNLMKATARRLPSVRVSFFACKVIPLLVLCGCTESIAAESLRLSKASEVETPLTVRHEMTGESGKTTLFVEKQAIVTEEDLESANRSSVDESSFDFKLKDSGADKLAEATKDGIGVRRIAILINGEMICAPVVNARLGRSFSVTGVGEIADDLDIFCWKFQGKSDEEIARLLKDVELREMEKPLEKAEKPVYHTDEEYADLKKQREQAGLFFLDEMPDEKELDERLEKGMNAEDVVRVFGRANSKSTGSDGGLKELTYRIAPEKKPLKGGDHVDAFSVYFENGKAVRWGHSIWANDKRAEKSEEKSFRRLAVKLPDFGMDDERFGLIRWIEELQFSLKDGEVRPHAQDYGDLISIVTTTVSEDDTASISVNCSLMKLLIEYLPDVAALKNPDEDRINLSRLNDVLKPYTYGEKHFPDDAAPEK